jgi:hypothetical protein
MGNYVIFDVFMAVTDYYCLLGCDTILFLDSYQHIEGTLKMKEAGSSEMLFRIYQITRCHISEDSILNWKPTSVYQIFHIIVFSHELQRFISLGTVALI